MADDRTSFTGTWETLPSPSQCRPETRLNNSRLIRGPRPSPTGTNVGRNGSVSMADFDLAGDEVPVMGMEARVRPELRPGERLVWVGQPSPARWKFQTLPILLFALPWTTGALLAFHAPSGLWLPVSPARVG